ncbi:MAG: putative transcriptional regulator, Crp/Fnr family [Segetibacter sp.]|nr:putative transcriptional regulator, Crp/Fnr family [Segetibacter sp.]
MFGKIKKYFKKLVPALTSEDLQALEEMLTAQHLKKGDYLVKQGQICRYVSFINSGLLRLFSIEDGKEICTGFVRENDYISEYTSFLTQQPSTENIEALEDCEVINLSFTNMQALYKTHPVFEQFGRKIAEQLFITLSNYNTRLLALTPEDRYRIIVDTQPYVIQRVPQYMVASFVGVSPEHLSRIRKKLSQKSS